MQIKPITVRDFLRNNLIEYAKVCEWEACPVLAKKMKENKFLNRERIFVATENNKII
jgi:hypothetical protein